MDLKFASVRLTTGPRIHYAEQGDGDGEPIVFLHGWPDSWFSFSRVIPSLSRRLHAFALDQRGFGDSEKLDSGYQIGDFAGDVVAFLDAVSIRRATIVGHSFGSFVTRCVAVTNPERIARMILIGTGMFAANSVTRQVQATMGALPDPIPVEFARDFQASTVYAPIPEPFFERIVAESLKLPARLWREVFDGLLAYEDTQQLPRIVTPTFLLWGERDALFPSEDQDRLVAAIPGTKLIKYPETGHCPNWERPERVATDLEIFLRQSG
jgi:non-heme chloroperoxidase